MPIRDEQGNFVQWFGTNTDVTEQKLAEEQVTRQAQELRVLNERLTGIGPPQDQVLRQRQPRVPHTVNSDARAAGGCAGRRLRRPPLCCSRSIARLPPKRPAAPQACQHHARFLPHRGRAPSGFVPANRVWAPSRRNLRAIFALLAKRRGLRLVVDCPPLGEPVYVDRDMWEKIVLNLSSNAFKFTLDGEIEVSLGRSDECRVSSERKEEPRATHPSSLATPGCVTLTVRDTGVGIPVEELPQMFERFHRVEHSRGANPRRDGHRLGARARARKTARWDGAGGQCVG